MSRRVWTGILAGVLAATVLLGVAGAAYRAGQHDEVVTRTVTEGTDGEVVRVVGHGWGYGPGPGFFIFPLIGIVALVLLARGWRGGYGGHGPYGGRFGPGPWGHSPEEWHRRMHEEQEQTARQHR